MKRLLPIIAVVLGVVLAFVAVLVRDRCTAPPVADAGDGGVQRLSTFDPETRPARARARATPTDAGGQPAAAAIATAKGEVVVSGAWGSQPGQFGRRRDPESNPEAPMALAAGPAGELAVVDQINARVQRFRDGKLVGVIKTGGDTIQDLALGDDGRTVLLDRLADKNVQVYDADGKLLNEVPIVGKGVPEGGGVTGVFAVKDGIYVEREHGALVRIADGRGNSDPNRGEIPGRPTRDGRLYVAAQLVDAPRGLMVVRAVDAQTGAPAWEQPIQLASSILHLLMLDSDRQGNVYLAADVGRESPEPPYPIVDERIVLLRLGPGGTPRGHLDIPAFKLPEENFRPITVDDVGNVYVMVAGAEGVTVMRYSFP